MPIIRDHDSQLYAFSAGDLETNELRVLRFQGTEGISEIFRFDIELVSRTSDIDFTSVVGKPAAFAMTLGNEPRYVNGMLSHFEQGPLTKGYTHYFAELVPRVWTLLHRIDTRIFQNKNVQAILESVLKDAGIQTTSYRFALQGTYKEREYCVQYQESDWAFLSRLMEEEGIFYFFEHKEDDHVLVIADNTSVHAAIAGETEIPFRATANLDTDGREYVASFRWSESVRIGAVSMRNYAFKTPKANLDARNKASDNTELELYEYEHGAYAAADVGKQRAKVRLEEQQALRKVATGQGVVTRFIPGYKFSLEGHARADLAREYLLTDVRHQGYSPQALEEQLVEATNETEYTNEFRCIPSDVVYRPLRVTPAPCIRGTQTATVSGPSGEEIYCDEYGRVKLHFHWDRRPEADENSSCWVRSVQTFVGSIWIPRVGQEVVVAFHEGDPDQPFILGRVPNADLMPPYSLPDEKTKTSLKSASTSGAQGFNEIRFEDKKGSEQLFIHGERNLDQRVKNALMEWVGEKRHLIVKSDQCEKIEGNKHLEVVGDQDEKIGGSFMLKVGVDRHAHVANDSLEHVDKDHSLVVGGSAYEDVTSDKNLSVTGNLNQKVGQTVSLDAGMNLQEKVGMNYALDAGMAVHIKAGMTCVIEAGVQLSLKVGGNFVDLNPAGVFINGTLLMLNSGGSAGSGAGCSTTSPSAAAKAEDANPDKPVVADDAKPGKTVTPEGREAPRKPATYGAQAMTLKKASQSGAPFCEKCEEAKRKQGAEQQGHMFTPEAEASFKKALDQIGMGQGQKGGKGQGGGS